MIGREKNVLYLEKVKIGSFNCQGIQNKIEDFIFQRELRQYDIFAVNETWLSNGTDININGYKFFPLCRKKELGKTKGGIGWFIREDLRKWIKILYNISDENFLWCKLDKTFFNFTEDLYICSVYIPPEYSSREKRLGKDHFKRLTENILKIKSENIILVGDFNARTRLYEDIIESEKNVEDYMPASLSSCVKLKRSNQDKKGNKYGKLLTNLCLKSNLYIANGRTLGDLQGKYTCYERNGASTVDYAVISENLHSSIDKFSISEPFLTSDHCVLRLTIKLTKKINKLMSKEQSFPRIKWNDNNKNNFLKFMKIPSTIKRIKEIENIVDNGQDKDASNIIKQINDIYTISNKLLYKPSKNKHKSTRPKKWYDSSCFEMSKRLKLVSKLLSQSPKNSYLRGRLVTTRKEYKKLIRQKKKEWKNHIINELENMKTQNSKEYWKIINELQGKTKMSNISNPEKFERFFKKLYSEEIQNKGTFHENIEDTIKKYFEDENIEGKRNEILDAEITVEELKKHIEKLKNNKSTGPDGIPSEMIKCSPDILINLILKVINKIKESRIYPDIWCLGITSLIFKNGDDEDPNNYRGINVSDVLSKLFISIINERFNKILVQNKIIGDYQIGFKEKCRPADHIFVLKNIIDKYLGNGKKVYACFIDYEKAYDNVWREGLYYKMMKLGITKNIITLIKNMYDKNKQSLKMNGHITDPIPTIKGLKQGCVISPIIFNMFINELPKCFNESCQPVKINNTNISCLMYADDIVLLSESREGLIKSLKNISTYNKKWCLNINKNKTKIMTFQRFGKLKCNNIKYDEHTLEDVKQFKYLGTIIDKSSSFKQNDIFLKKKGLRASFSIINKLGTNLRVSSLIKIFEKVIEPIILYNCEISQAFLPNNWSFIKFKENIWNQNDEISKVLNSFLRQILGVRKKTTTWGILSETGKYPLIMKVYIQIMKYWTRLLHIESKYMQESLINSHNIWNLNKNSWFRTIEYLIKYTNMELTFKIEDIISKPNKFLEEFKLRLHKKFLNFWNEEVNSKKDGKLDFYNNTKKQFSFEKYLDIIKREYRIPLTSIRLSSHNLPVEKLRYQKVRRDKRLCQICDLKEIGDEMHYLTKCENANMKSLRCIFLNNIKKIQQQFEKFECQNIMMYCLNMKDESIYESFSTYVKDIFEIYKEEEEIAREIFQT